MGGLGEFLIGLKLAPGGSVTNVATPSSLLFLHCGSFLSEGSREVNVLVNPSNSDNKHK